MWKETVKKIRPISEEWLRKAKERLDDLTKPLGSLGVLEELAARYAAIREEVPISMPRKEIFVFVGDHGVVAEGVSAFPQEVTAQMVGNFLSGGAGVNVLAKCAGAEVFVIDIGMKDDLDKAPGLIRRKVIQGTGNIMRGPAMSRHEAEQAIDVGIEMAAMADSRGTSMIATGDMGIGNTTPSSWAAKESGQARPPGPGRSGRNRATARSPDPVSLHRSFPRPP